jgi:hypothetical protein
MKKALLVFLLLGIPDAVANGRFLHTSEGELVSDIELDLSTLPAFSWATDPFLKVPGQTAKAPVSAGADEREFKLQATTIEGSDAVAVVNDQVVRVGDRLGRRTVLRIGKDFVLLGDRGSVVESNLEQAAVETPQASKQSRAPASSEGEGTIRIEEVKK